MENHLVDFTEMVPIGSGAQQELDSVKLSRYACYLIVQNADPPKEVVQVEKYFVRENIYKGYLSLDDQPVNQRLVFGFINELQLNFGVSKDVAKYRLIKLGFLKDATDISISSIMRNL